MRKKKLDFKLLYPPSLFPLYLNTPTSSFLFLLSFCFFFFPHKITSNAMLITKLSRSTLASIVTRPMTKRCYAAAANSEVLELIGDPLGKLLTV